MGNILLSASTTSNILAGLDTAAKEGESIFWTVVSQYVAPFLFCILLVAVLFQIGKAGLTWDKMHSQWEENSIRIIALLVIMGIVGSFWWWGSKMLGKNATAPTACLSTNYIEESSCDIWNRLQV